MATVPIPSPGVPLAFGVRGAPLVIVLHDAYGRLPWLEPYAAALADRGGFRVLVPDLVGGVATVDDDDAERLALTLDRDAALASVDASVADARAEGSQRVGVVGFALGGTLALQAAQRGSADAVVAYYATADPGGGIIPAPVLLHLAESDDTEPADGVVAFVDSLLDDGTPVAQHTYAGTGHLFANASRRDLVDTRAAALAFARTTVFLEKHLAD